MQHDVSDGAMLTPIANNMVNRGAQAVLLGCTELPLVFDPECVDVPVYDCLDIYARAVVKNYYLYNGDQDE